jgi:carbamoyltransferase
MEFGPRALGNRSILGDPRNQDTQTDMNLKIKFRELFRPFSHIVLREKVSEWFDLDCDSPYMLMVANVKKNKLLDFKDPGGMDLMKRLNEPRSEVPAITHIDCSARIQTIHQDLHPFMHKVLTSFDSITGVPVLVNTSFNVRGEPFVRRLMPIVV